VDNCPGRTPSQLKEVTRLFESRERHGRMNGARPFLLKRKMILGFVMINAGGFSIFSPTASLESQLK